MAKRRRRCWSYSAGEYPHTVRVFERTPSGVIYGGTWDPTLRDGRGNERRQSLGHRDRDRAEAWAKAQAGALAKGSATQSGPFVPTVANVFALYAEKATPDK